MQKHGRGGTHPNSLPTGYPHKSANATRQTDPTPGVLRAFAQPRSERNAQFRNRPDGRTCQWWATVHRPGIESRQSLCCLVRRFQRPSSLVPTRGAGTIRNPDRAAHTRSRTAGPCSRSRKPARFEVDQRQVLRLIGSSARRYPPRQAGGRAIVCEAFDQS